MKEIRDKYGDLIGIIREEGDPTGAVIGGIVGILLFACLYAVYTLFLVFAPTWLGWFVLIILMFNGSVAAVSILSSILTVVYIPYLIIVLVCKFKYKMPLPKMFKLLFRYFLVGPFAYPEIIELKNTLENAK